MTPYDEHWEIAESIQPNPSSEKLSAEHRGVIVARPHSAGWFISARYRPDLASPELENFTSFAHACTYTLLKTGRPGAPWEADAAGGWRARWVEDELAREPVSTWEPDPVLRTRTVW